MRKLACIVALIVAGAGVQYVSAGGGCCPGAKSADMKKQEAKVEKKDASACTVGGEISSTLNLTEEQKTQLASLQEECAKTECTYTSQKKYSEGLKKVLTAEQLKQYQAECEKAGCAFPLSEGSKEG